MAEQHVLAVDPQLDFRSTCQQVLLELGQAHPDLDALSEQLQAVKRADIPGIGRLWPQLKGTLSEGAQKAYEAELRQPGHVEAVFPTGTTKIVSPQVGVAVMSVTQFRKLHGSKADATDVYRSMRAAAAERLRQSLASRERTATLPLPPKARAREVAATVMGELSERITQATSLAERRRRAGSLTGRLAGFLGKTMQWNRDEASEEAELNLYALVHDLQCLVDDPAAYLHDAIAERMGPEAEALGRQQALDDLPEIVTTLLVGFAADLRARVKGRAAVGQVVRMAPAVEAVHPRRRLRRARSLGKSAIVTSADGSAPERAESSEGFETVGEVRVRMPWLSSSSATVTLQRYTDRSGNTILCIEGQSDEALAVESSIRRNKGERHSMAAQSAQWRHVLSRLAGLAGDFGSHPFPILNTTNCSTVPDYDNVTIQYDKQSGGTQKRRTYFVTGRIESYVEPDALLSLGIDARTPVAILLGRCDKYTEADMIRLFRAFNSLAALRKAVAL